MTTFEPSCLSALTTAALRGIMKITLERGDNLDISGLVELEELTREELIEDLVYLAQAED